MLEYAGGSISDYDWDHIQPALEGVKTILEFGSGMSTKKFVEAGYKVTSVETNQYWIDKVEAEVDIKIIKWNNNTFPADLLEWYDLVFVDGIDPRDKQVDIARYMTNRIVIHDAGRTTEKKLMQKYLEGWNKTPLGRSMLLEKP